MHKQVSPIVPFNTIPHANIPPFQLVFVETLYIVIWALESQTRDNTVFRGRQCLREGLKNVRM